MYIGLCSSRPKVREGATLKTMANSFSLNNNCLNYVTVVIYNNRSYATMLLTITVRSLEVNSGETYISEFSRTFKRSPY